MDPVKMKAPMPQVNSQSASHEDADEAQATEHAFHETLNTEISEEVIADADVEVAEEVAEEVESKPAGRRRRRAASSGIITA
jgi:ribonuclease E